MSKEDVVGWLTDIVAADDSDSSGFRLEIEIYPNDSLTSNMVRLSRIKEKRWRVLHCVSESSVDESIERIMNTYHA